MGKIPTIPMSLTNLLVSNLNRRQVVYSSVIKSFPHFLILNANSQMLIEEEY